MAIKIIKENVSDADSASAYVLQMRLNLKHMTVTNLEKLQR